MDTTSNSVFPPWFGPNRIRGELYLVPPDKVERAWREAKYAIQAPVRGIGRGYDIERLHARLLVGIDRLWLAAFTRVYKDARDTVAGVVITFLGPPPKDRPTRLFPKDKKSLTAHFISGIHLCAWMPDAIEKIAAYGKEHECKQLFALARKDWFYYLHPFFDRFERVGLARDRMTKLGRNVANGIQRPGHFRLLSKDLPPRMSFDCARHQTNRIYISPPKGATHGKPHFNAQPANDSAARGADERSYPGPEDQSYAPGPERPGYARLAQQGG